MQSMTTQRQVTSVTGRRWIFHLVFVVQFIMLRMDLCYACDWMLWFSTYAVPPSVTVISLAVTPVFGGRSWFRGAW
jgi:hypothetical protein